MGDQYQIVLDQTLSRVLQPRACDHCFVRKVKCERTIPCKTCIDTGLTCSYQRRPQYKFKASADGSTSGKGGTKDSPQRTKKKAARRFQESQDSQTPIELTFDSKTASVDPGREHRFVPSTHQCFDDGGLTAVSGDWFGQSSIVELNNDNETHRRPSTSLVPMERVPEFTPAAFPDFSLAGMHNLPESIRSHTSDPLSMVRMHPSPKLAHAQLRWRPPSPKHSSPALSAAYLSPLGPARISQLINIFLARLHLSMPFFRRSFLLVNLRSRRHEYDRQFNALVHSICAYTLFQAIHAQDKPLLPDRLKLAESVLSYVAEQHGGADFGQDPSVEAVMTSFFLFGCQFCRGNHNAATVRFREALTLAEIMRLHDPSSYGNISPDEMDRRVRTVTALAFVERIYALQHGSTLQMPRLMGLDIMAFHGLIKRVSSAEEAVEYLAVEGLGRMIDQIDFVDETVVRCWKSDCNLDPNTNHISAEKLVQLLRRYSKPLEASPSMEKGGAQHADILLTRHWIRNMLWNLAFRHGFTSLADPNVELRPGYAIDIAAETIDACDFFDIRCLETHGVGLAEKLYDIASNCVRIAQTFPANGGAFAGDFGIPTSDHDSCATSISGTLDSSSSASDPSGWVTQMPTIEMDWAASRTAQVMEILNRFLALFALFRKGKHPFLKPFVQLMAGLEFPQMATGDPPWDDGVHMPLVM